MTVAARITNRACPRCAAVFGAEAAFCPNDGTALEPRGEPAPDQDRYIGALIHEDIEIRGVAGAGAMGRVYRAHQRGTDRDVAVKILHRELSGNAALVQRFHREAKIASRLQHPHVVEVYLAGQLADGALYIVMEYLDGLSLAAAAQASGGSLPIERALRIVLQICDAVGEAHSRGVVHRDLKPENVMLVRRADTADWVKVLDFGIARVSLGDQSMETAAGLIFGSARYISPEGAQGATVGPPGDVYSLSVICYELLAGRTPFHAEQPVGLLVKHLHEEPPDLCSWPAAAGVPEPVARVIMQNLDKDPSKRASSARALGNALAAAAKEANITLSEVGVVARMSVSDTSAPRTPAESAPEDAPARAALAPPDDDGEPDARGSPEGRAVADVDASADDELARESWPREEARARSPWRSPILVVLAFLLGVAMSAVVAQVLSYHPDTERTAHVQRTRRALARGSYVAPPGENVRDLVKAGLVKWPDDSVLMQIQSDAAHEIVTRAMAARSVGDLLGARDLARTAHELDPTDMTAKLLFDQYEHELHGDAGSL